MILRSKLFLNRNNDSFYRAICSKSEPLNSLRISSSNRLISKAFSFYCEHSMGSTGSEIAQFIEKLASGLMFTTIIVQDKVNAYKLFETLNARGVQLSTPDLLKNTIFSMIIKYEDISEEDLDYLDKKWSDIVSDLGS